MIDSSKVFAVILAGGSGVRFWPLSRETCPKQMLQIVGEDTLLRQTIKRIHGFVPPRHIWIVTTEDKAQDLKYHFEPLGPLANEIQLIREPVGRNTAPAVGLAALYLHHLYPDSVMIVMPSDHAIPDKDTFLKDLMVAIRGAEEDYLVTFGIKPNRPETGYGYLRADRSSKTAAVDGLLRVDRFVEKPDLQTALDYLSDGCYFWNSGIFVWKTSRILSEIEKYLPALYKTLKEMEAIAFKPERSNQPSILQPQIRNLQWSTLYAGLESTSIDYGVMEQSPRTLMVPANFQWSDLGSWVALDDILPKNEKGNILRGNAVDIGSQNSTIFSGERLIATIGLKDMVVVDTPDATLVTPKERVQEVRKIVEVLRENSREEYLLHKTVERPWGGYTVLEKGDGYKVKRVFLKPRARLSLQLHRKRSEHWVVISGTAKVTRENDIYVIQANESTYVPMCTRHRLENPGNIPLQVIEIQNGDYLEEDDIERFEDDYGR